MTVKVLKGAEHLFTEGCHYDKDIWTNELIVNLNERWGYISSEFIESINTLSINLRQGEVTLTFSEPIKGSVLDHEEKDQLVFKLIK